MAKLTFVLEDGQEVVVPLTERVTIGREEDNDVVVDDDRLSAHHAELLQNADGSIQVFDLKSEAGTFVNGERQMSCTLLHGDKLAFGPLAARLDLDDMEEVAAPPPAPEAGGRTAAQKPDELASHAEEIARLEQTKSRLKAEVETAEKELRGWEQRAEKERALYLARIESLRAEEEKLAPAQAAAKQAEDAHQEWLAAVKALSAQHEELTASFERITDAHSAKETALKQLTDAEATAEQEVAALNARLQQVRDECEQDEAVLNSLRQQIIEHEKRIEENRELDAAREDQVRNTENKIEQLELLAKELSQVEARVEELSSSEKKLIASQLRHKEIDAHHAALSAACAELESKRQQMEAALKELEDRHAQTKKSHEEAEALLNNIRAESTAETGRLEEARAARAGLERELAVVTQQLNDTRQQAGEAAQQVTDAHQRHADARQRLAAIEQRLRDAESSIATTTSQAAEARRKADRHEADAREALVLAEQNQALAARIESARGELAGLEQKAAELLASQAQNPVMSERPVAFSFSEPHIVQVGSVRLAPVRMKSESTRVADAVEKQAAPRVKVKRPG